jgi:hypothetical protein
VCVKWSKSGGSEGGRPTSAYSAVKLRHFGFGMERGWLDRYILQYNETGILRITHDNDNADRFGHQSEQMIEKKCITGRD